MSSRYYAPMLAALTLVWAASAQAQITYDGTINEPEWTLLDDDTGGAVTQFGAQEITALHAYLDFTSATAGTLNIGVGGAVLNNNRILVFVDSRAGGFNTANFDRAGLSGSPPGLVNLNSGIQFDPGFEPDYCLAIGTNTGEVDYFFDLVTLDAVASSKVLLSTNTGIDPALGDTGRGFEVGLSFSDTGSGVNIELDGQSVSLFVALLGDSGFLSNQFMSPASFGENNFESGAVNFELETPDPLTVAFASETSASTEGWRMLSAPGAGLTVNSLTAVNLVRGVSDSSPPNIYTAYGGDQTTNGNDGFTAPSALTEDLEPGKGFFWFFFDSTIPRDLSAGELANVEALPVDVSASVAPLIADQTVQFLQRATNDGFYLAGNPFDTNFSLGGVSVVSNPTGTALEASDVVQIWDPAGADDPSVEGNVGPGGYTAYSLSGTINPQVVAPWQGFWLEVLEDDGVGGTTDGDPPTTVGVDVTYDILSEGQPSGTFVGRQSAYGNFKLDLFGSTPEGQRIRNEVSLLFHDEAAEGWDRFDGSSPGSFGTPFVLAGLIGDRGEEEVWKYQDSRSLFTEGTQTFRLAYTGFGVQSAYEFAWPSLENVPAEWTLTLRDLMTGTEVDMRTQASYAFETMAGEPEARFEVVVTANAVSTTEEALPSGFAVGEAYPNPTATAATLGVTVAEAQDVEVTVYDVLGRVVLADVVPLRAGAEEQIEVGVSGLPAGTYVVRVVGEAFAATRRLAVVR